MTDSLPFYILQRVKSLPFHIPEAWKRYPLRAEPPRMSHYREYPPVSKLKKSYVDAKEEPNILVRQRVWIMKLLHDSIYDPLKQTKRTLWCFDRLIINSVSGCFRRFSGKFLKQTEHLKRHSPIFLVFLVGNFQAEVRISCLQTFFEY